MIPMTSFGLSGGMYADCALIKAETAEEIYNYECPFHIDLYQKVNKPQKYLFWIYLQECAGKISTRIIRILTG